MCIEANYQWLKPYADINGKNGLTIKTFCWVLVVYTTVYGCFNSDILHSIYPSGDDEMRYNLKMMLKWC